MSISGRCAQSLPVKLSNWSMVSNPSYGRDFKSTGSSKTKNLDSSGNESDSSEELLYGPGFVTKLKNRYMTVAVRGPSGTRSRPALRRATSFEEVYDEDIINNNNNSSKSKEIVDKGIRVSDQVVLRRKKDSTTSSAPRCRSVDVLSTLCQSTQRPLDAFLNNFSNDKLVIVDRNGVVMTGNDVRSSRLSTTSTKKRSTAAPILFGIQIRELPPPDMVRSTRRIFESTKHVDNQVREESVKSTNSNNRYRSKSCDRRSDVFETSKPVSSAASQINLTSSKPSLPTKPTSLHSRNVDTVDNMKHTSENSKTAERKYQPSDNHFTSLNSKLSNPSESNLVPNLSQEPQRSQAKQIGIIRPTTRELDSGNGDRSEKHHLDEKNVAIRTTSRNWGTPLLIVNNNNNKIDKNKNFSENVITGSSTNNINFGNNNNNNHEELKTTLFKASKLKDDKVEKKSEDDKKPFPARFDDTKETSTVVKKTLKDDRNGEELDEGMSRKWSVNSSNPSAQTPVAVTAKGSDQPAESKVAFPLKLKPFDKEEKKVDSILKNVPSSSSPETPDQQANPFIRRISSAKPKSSPPTTSNSMVFNFVNSNKEVTHIENDGLDMTKRRNKSKEDEPSSAVDGVTRPVSPCQITFIGDNIILGKSALSSKPKSKKLSIKFCETSPQVFEYPSDDNVDGDFSPAFADFSPTKTPGLGPSFQLGITRTPDRGYPFNNNNNNTNKETNEERKISDSTPEKDIPKTVSTDKKFNKFDGEKWPPKSTSFAESEMIF